MAFTYLGHVQPCDPIFPILREEILPAVLGRASGNTIRVFAADPARTVLVYEDRKSKARVLGKFFHRHGDSPEKAERRAQHEYQVLQYLQSLGLSSRRHHTVAPLALRFDCGRVLFERYVSGEPLYGIWGRTIPGQQDRGLYRSLSNLAYLLARIHNQTVTGIQVPFTKEFPYFDKVVARLWRRGRIKQSQIDHLYHLRWLWESDHWMYSDTTVLLHGDATPANFLATGHHGLVAIDFERARLGDRAYDLGMIAGELQHWAMRQFGAASVAEPFIGHFFWEYARHFPDQHRAFSAITRRSPYYQGLTLLRIARNSDLHHGYAQHLVQQGLACLDRRR